MPRLFTIALLLATTTIAHAAPPPQDAPERAADPRDKVICKRFAETGSLVRSNRICKTKADWQRDRDNLPKSESLNSCGSAGDGIGCR